MTMSKTVAGIEMRREWLTLTVHMVGMGMMKLGSSTMKERKLYKGNGMGQGMYKSRGKGTVMNMMKQMRLNTVWGLMAVIYTTVCRMVQEQEPGGVGRKLHTGWYTGLLESEMTGNKGLCVC